MGVCWWPPPLGTPGETSCLHPGGQPCALPGSDMLTGCHFQLLSSACASYGSGAWQLRPWLPGRDAWQLQLVLGHQGRPLAPHSGRWGCCLCYAKLRHAGGWRSKVVLGASAPTMEILGRSMFLPLHVISCKLAHAWRGMGRERGQDPEGLEAMVPRSP